MNSNDRFEAILQRIQETHDKKGADYGTDEDPFANITAAKELGIEPWVACVLRMNDKMMRLKTFIKRGTLANESVEDSLLDLAVYAIIGLVTYSDQAQDEDCGCLYVHGGTCVERKTYGAKYGMMSEYPAGGKSFRGEIPQL